MSIWGVLLHLNRELHITLLLSHLIQPENIIINPFKIVMKKRIINQIHNHNFSIKGGNAIMKLYIREFTQQQYHYQSSNHPILPKNKAPKPGDTFHDHWSDYHIDRVTYAKDGLNIFATRTN